MTNQQVLLRLPEAAAILGLSRSSIYKLVMSKRLASVLIGRSRRIPAQAVEEYVRELLAEQLGDGR